MRSLCAAGFLALVAACAPLPQDTSPQVARIAVPLPEMNRFAPRPIPLQPVSNVDLARDFLDLTFLLESGREVPTLTRFDGPITVNVTGEAPQTLFTDLEALLIRLRSEAGIDILRGTDGANQITINAIPRALLRQSLPEAACFVIPNVLDLYDYQQARRSGLVDWTRLSRRRKMAVFLPNDVAPQEIRDCLHEELAQALGPVNDLYRLPDSIFNDDNIHTVLTGFDMLVLRITYDRALENGLTRDQVARRLPAILTRLNPGGDSIAPTNSAATPRIWIDQIERALGPGSSDGQRRRAANRAVDIAEAAGWNDHRTGFSHYILGRFTGARDPALAFRHFIAADRYYRASPRTRLHRAHVAGELAAGLILTGRVGDALGVLNPAIDLAYDAQNASVLAQLLLIKADVLEALGRIPEAEATRLDSLGWARYGFLIEEARPGARQAAQNR